MITPFGTRDWENSQNIGAKSYTCGHSGCSKEVSSEKGWRHLTQDTKNKNGLIYVCPSCKKPTFFDVQEGVQIPGAATGNEIENLPSDIELLWLEIRKSTSIGAYTSAVLSGRKLLMHIAVSQKADQDLKFAEYVDYLVNNHFAPPNSKEWVDRIRIHGNEATHEISIKTMDDASEIVTFLEMLLKFIYEFPAKAKKSSLKST